MSNTVTIHGYDVEVFVISVTPLIPAKISGPPEDCYPEEGGEIEWEAVTGNDLLNDYINNDESCFESVEEQLWDQVSDSMEDDRY